MTDELVDESGRRWSAIGVGWPEPNFIQPCMAVPDEKYSHVHHGSWYGAAIQSVMRVILVATGS